MKCKKRIFACALSCLFFFQVFSLGVEAQNNNKAINIPDSTYTIAPFSMINMGRAGDVKINQKNQELKIERNDLSLPGCDFPVTVIFNYSSYFPEEQKWHFIYDMKLSWSDENKLELVREDGTHVTYVKSGSYIDGKVKWIIPEELGITDYILSNSNSTDLSEFVLYSKLNGLYFFDTDGRLIRRQTKDQTACIDIVYDDQTGRLSKVRDDIGRTYEFSYYHQNLVREIKVLDEEGQLICAETEEGETVPYIIKYFYDDCNLIKVIYPDGEQIRYGYDDKLLTSVCNVEGEKIFIAYLKAGVHTVHQIAGDQSKLLLKIERTNQGIILTDEYREKVQKKFDYNATTKIRSVADKIIEKNIESHILHVLSLPSDRLLHGGLDESLSHVDRRELEWEAPEYSYDVDSGLVESLVDSCGNTISFKYDASRNLVKMSAVVSGIAEEIKNEYIYKDDRLQSIVHNGVEYNFLYDIWGNNAGVTIGGKSYLSYAYKDGKSELCERESYGNGQQIDYYYDDSNRLTGVSSDGGKSLQFEYQYSKDSVTILDHSTDIIQKYTADGLQVVDSNTACTLLKASSKEGEMEVNINGITSVISVDEGEVKGREGNSQEYLYKFNDIDAVLSVIRDHFDRSEKMTVQVSTGEKINSEIQYWDTDAYVSPLVKNYRTKYLNGKYVENWTYSYNPNGKIENVLLNGTPYAHYMYDEAGQLIESIDYQLGQATKYQYDKGGGISSVDLIII